MGRRTCLKVMSLWVVCREWIRWWSPPMSRLTSPRITASMRSFARPHPRFTSIWYRSARKPERYSSA